MKKILVALTIALSIGTAEAMPIMTSPTTPTPTHNNGYSVGYRHGKNDAYNNVARTAVVVGLVAVAAVIIYHAGEQSRWTANDKGVVYKF